MAEQLLQVNFKLNAAHDEYKQMATQLASAFAEVDGLRWKVWIMNEAENEAGGIYLFESEALLKAYLEGPLAAQVVSHPALKDIKIKQFAVLPDPTEITRGPVKG